jgi:hypothetical protein
MHFGQNRGGPGSGEPHEHGFQRPFSLERRQTQSMHVSEVRRNMSQPREIVRGIAEACRHFEAAKRFIIAANLPQHTTETGERLELGVCVPRVTGEIASQQKEALRLGVGEDYTRAVACTQRVRERAPLSACPNEVLRDFGGVVSRLASGRSFQLLGDPPMKQCPLGGSYVVEDHVMDEVMGESERPVVRRQQESLPAGLIQPGCHMLLGLLQDTHERRGGHRASNDGHRVQYEPPSIA